MPHLAGNFGHSQIEALEQRMHLSTVLLGQQPGAPDNTQFHGDAARTGFDQNETVLTPSNVASSFGQVWQSPVLDGHVYATPLYLDGLTIQGSGNAANHAGDGIQSASFQGKTLGVVFAATSGGTLYAIAAQDTNGPTGIAPGTILWKTHLGNPFGSVDGLNMGALSTPIIDLKSNRIYVTAQVTDYLLPAGDPNHGVNNWEVFALNLNDGSVVPGWPVAVTQTVLNSVNQNKLDGGNTVVFSPAGADQRGALNLSADGSTLYVDFACYNASNPGWMTTVATGVTNGAANSQIPAVMSSYSGVDSSAVSASGGMWGAGGPAVDANGNVFVTTGDSPGGTDQTPGAWGNSVLEWAPGQILTLIGAYTPWNYQTQDTIDSDLGGSSPILINLPSGSSSTTELLATGGKQGNGYLVDAGNNLNNPSPNPDSSPAPYPANLTERPPVVAPDQDPSLYDPNAIRSYFNPPQPGPLALFQPYNETSASGNTAKARDTPATFVGPDGSTYIMWAGSSKSAIGSGTPVAPSLYLTKVVTSPGQPAYLTVTAQNSQVMSLPGASLITGNGTSNEVEWIVDAGVQRTDSLTSFAHGVPTLYAYDPITLQPLWSSAYEQLDMGGKYNSIAVARGNVFVGTDRIQAFGLTTDTIVDDSVVGPNVNQFNYVGSGWVNSATTSTMGTFDGTVSTDSTPGDYATLDFIGPQIQVYANESSTSGSVTISVDGANAQTISLMNTNSSPNSKGQGDVLVYTLSGLGSGTHVLKFLNVSGTVALDRVEVASSTTAPASLGISITDGNVTTERGGILPYTINYNNAGSISGNTGTSASGVVIVETVPSNTTVDLANSTPGWTLVSGTGVSGSIYHFAIGNLAAGTTGSVVFSVDVSTGISGTVTSISNTTSIIDAASDHALANRITPLGAIVPPTTLSGSSGTDTFILKRDADQQHIDWSFAGNFGSVPIDDPAESLTLTGNGGNDVIVLNYTNGNPLPGTLHLNGTFTINGLTGTNPLANTTLEIGQSTVYISYAGPAVDPLPALRSYLQNGYNNGLWTGTPTSTTGVITSTAAAANVNQTTAIGYVDSSDGLIPGQPANSIELKYTLYGDTGLSGTVGFTDFMRMTQHYTSATGTWDTGDFNYDGSINSGDFSLLKSNYGATLPAPTPAVTPIISAPIMTSQPVSVISASPSNAGPATTTSDPTPNPSVATTVEVVDKPKKHDGTRKPARKHH
jgi:hypothetical protein